MTPRDGRLGIGAASEESLPVGGDLDAPPDATNEAGEAHKAVAAGFATRPSGKSSAPRIPPQ